MARLFISYSRKDTPAAKKIVEALAGGNDIWVDWEDISPAADWMDQILRGIEGVDAFLFLVSPDSIASEVCKVEVTHAAKNNKRIIPIVVRQVEPKDTLEIIRNLNWIFLRKEDNFKKGLEKVKLAINLDFAWVEEHSRLQTRALEWHRKKEPSLLLRGSDLRKARQTLESAVKEKKDPRPSDLQKTYVDFSSRNERRTWVARSVAALVIVVLALLSYTAITQRNEAVRNKAIAEANEQRANEAAAEAKANEKTAQLNAQKAQNSARQAIRQKQAAERAREEAEQSRVLASAQRSAARAQIYQFRPGELYTSTLLAIASWLTNPSAEAEEILRANISLLPIPVSRVQREGRINALEINAAGDAFVTASADGAVCAWKVSDGMMLFCATSPGSVNDAAFSPAENIIVSGDGAGVVQIINAENGAVEILIEFESSIRDVDVRYDGRYAAITSDNGVITLIDLRARAKAGIDLQANNIKFASFSPKGTLIATGNGEGTISIWDLASNNKPIETRKHKGAVTALQFSPNGKYIVTGGADGAVVMLDAKTGAEIYRRKHNDQIKDIAFNSDGSWFVTVSNDRAIRVWDTGTGDELLGMSQSNFVQAVQVSRDDRWIATTGDDNTVRVWSASTGTELFQIPIKGIGVTLGFSSDEKYLIAGDQNGTIHIWDLTAIPEPTYLLQFNGVTHSARYSPNGNWIAASDDRRVWLLKPGSLSPLKTTVSGNPFGELLSDIDQLVFSLNGAQLGALTANNEVVIYNTQTNAGKTIKPANRAEGFVFSPDEKQVIIGDARGGVHIYNAVTGELLSTPLTYTQGVTAMAAGGNLLALALGDALHILNLNTFKEVDSPESQGVHETLSFSPDGSLLASSNPATGQVHIWKNVNGIFELQKVIRKDDATSIAFNASNTLLAVGGVDDVYLINLAALEEYARIPHTGTVNSVSFSPDGSNLLTSSLGVLQFWQVAEIREVSTENLVEVACLRLVANFTQDEWNALFESEPFQILCPSLHIP
jgi:WD40 repeat protein